ncbi:MAG TPA: hypothetical protein VFD05_02395, partial [Bacilli bacterium]|nr:hypothetical protein [Bacilli bacterium]
MPFLLGRDVVGIVIDANNSAFNKGDIVWSNSLGYENRNGASASYLAINEERLYLLPPNVDPYQAVSTLHALTTAVLLLTRLVTPKAKSSILIQGGAGLVGTKLIEVAKILNLNISATAHPRDFPRLTKLGAMCLDYKNPEYTTKFDLLIDTSGQNSLNDNVKLLNNNGKLLMITKPRDTKFDPWDFYTNGKQILGFVLSKEPLEALDNAALFMNKYFAKGHFLSDDIEILDYKMIKKYHELVETWQQSGKRVVFKFD